MSNKSVHVRVPGKLFLAGEYAVTTVNHIALIAPVPRYLTVDLCASDDNIISSNQSDTTVEWVRDCQCIVPLNDNCFPIVTKSIEVAERYIKTQCKSIKNFELVIQSQLDDEQTGQKYGLGSSGAVTVATIKALLQFYQLPYTPLLIYKLAVIVHLELNSNGSFGDIAVSAFESLIVYSTVDKIWVMEQLEKYTLVDVLTKDWHSLIIKPLQWPKHCHLLVGWTKTPASSEQLVQDIIRFTNNKETYNTFLKESNQCVNDLIVGMEKDNMDVVAECFRRNQALLTSLSRHVEIEPLRVLCQIANKYGAVGKISGAGGGDCGFAFMTDLAIMPLIKEEWLQHDIKPLFILGETNANATF